MFIGFVAQAKLAKAKDRSMIGSDVLTTPSFFGPSCRLVDSQSTTQHWHTDPLTTRIETDHLIL